MDHSLPMPGMENHSTSQPLSPLDDVFFAAPENRDWLRTRQGRVMHYLYEYRLTRRLLPSVVAVLILLTIAAIIAVYRHAITREAIVIAVLALGVGVSLYVLQYPFAMNSRLRRLEREGELILGTVTAYRVAPLREDPFGWRDAVLDYQFTTRGGDMITGRRRYKSAILPHPPQPGETLAILYLNPTLYEVL